MTRIALMILMFVFGDDPKTARDYCERGQVNEKHRHDEEALADHEKAVELDPQLLDAWFTRSSLYPQRQEHAKAVAHLAKVIELKPGEFPALFNRGLYRQSMRDYGGAIADYSEVLDKPADFSRSASSIHRVQAGRPFRD